MGFKLWASGELLTSADVNAYLMKQTIISCTSGTRPSSPQDGMYIYETDTRYYRSYNSTLATWIVMGSNGPLSSTPALTSSGGGVGMGSGATRRGQYVRGPNGLVTYSFYIKIGTSPSSGTGQYLIDLPVTCASAFGGTDPEWSGAGRVTDNGLATYSAVYYIPGSNLNVVSIFINGGVQSAGSPYTIAVGDDWSGSITYRAAAGS